MPTHLSVLASFEAGGQAQSLLSFDTPLLRQGVFEVTGTEGTMVLPDPNTFGGPVQIRRRGDGEWRDVPLTHANAAQSRGIGLLELVRARRAGAHCAIAAGDPTE